MRFIAPVSDRISQQWDANPSYYKQYGQNGHTGIDYASKEGTPIRASGDGTIVFAGHGRSHGGFTEIAGNCLLIDHGDVYTAYSHLSRFERGQGQRVKQGDIIAYTGRTGVVTGPHLHFEFWGKPTNWQNGWSGRLDPNKYLKEVKKVEKISLEIARILAFGILGRNGETSKPNALAGQSDDDLKKNHVGKELSMSYIRTLYNSAEAKNFRSKIGKIGGTAKVTDADKKLEQVKKIVNG